MDPVLLSAITAVGGMALVATALYYCMPRRLDGKMGDAIILKLLHAKNLDRVKKLIAATPKSYFAVYGAAIAAGEQTGSRDPAVVKPATKSAFDALADALAKRWVAAIMRGIMGGMVGGVSLYLGMREGVNSPTWVRALGGLAVLGGVWSLLRRNEIATVLAHGEAEVLPEIDRAFTGIDTSAPVDSDAE